MTPAVRNANSRTRWLGDEQVTVIARENKQEVWVEKQDGTLLCVYDRGLALNAPQLSSSKTTLRLAR
jgi:hypothetical protein